MAMFNQSDIGSARNRSTKGKRFFMKQPGTPGSKVAHDVDLDALDDEMEGSKSQRAGDPALKLFVREVFVSAAEFDKLVADYMALMDQCNAPENLKHLRAYAPSASARQKAFTFMLDMPDFNNSKMPGTQQARSCLGTKIISPFNSKYLIWRWIVLGLDATYAAFIVPIGTAMDGSYVSGERMSWYDIVSIGAAAIYLADIIIQFGVAWIAISPDLKQVLVVNGREIAKFYSRRGFIVDFLTTAPILIEIVFFVLTLVTQETPAWVAASRPWLKALRLIRFVRVFRICRMDFLTRLSGGTDSISPAVSTLSMLLFFVTFLVNVLGCLWHYVGTLGGEENSWLANKEVFVRVDGELETILLSDAGFWLQYLSSLYWATTTVTTVGYGDIVAVNSVEMVCSIVVEFMGVVIFGLLISSLSAVFVSYSKEARRTQVLQDRIREASDWMVTRRIPKGLRTSVRNFFTDVWGRNSLTCSSESTLLVDLPYHLRTEIAMSILKSSLARAPQPILANLPTAIQRLLVATMVPATILTGHDLVKEGTPADSAWFLNSGEMLAMYKYRVAAVKDAPQLLGLYDLAEVLVNGRPGLGKPVVVGYRANTMCDTWQISLQEFVSIFEAFPPVRTCCLSSSQLYLEAAARNPSPVSQFNAIVRDILRRIVEVLGDISAAQPVGHHRDHEASFGDLSLLEPTASDLSFLRKREIELQVTKVLCHLVQKPDMPKDLSGYSHWERLALYVSTGAYQTYMMDDILASRAKRDEESLSERRTEVRFA